MTFTSFCDIFWVYPKMTNFILGDFSAWVGRNYQLWKDVIGKEGWERSSNGLLLLASQSQCMKIVSWAYLQYCITACKEEMSSHPDQWVSIRIWQCLTEPVSTIFQLLQKIGSQHRSLASKSTRKRQTLHQNTPEEKMPLPILIHRTTLEQVQNFSYFGSILSSNGMIE